MKYSLVLAVSLLVTVAGAFAQDPAPVDPTKESTIPPAIQAAPHPPPMTNGEKFRYHLKHAYSPLALGKMVFGATILQAWDKPTEWGQGMEGFGRRYGSSFAQHAVKKTIDFAVSAALDEDPRRPRSGLVGFWPRTGYAISHTYIVRKDEGGNRIAIGRISGVLGGAMISRTWQPERNQNFRSGIISAGQSAAVDVGLRVLHEFWPEIKRGFRRR